MDMVFFVLQGFSVTLLLLVEVGLADVSELLPGLVEGTHLGEVDLSSLQLLVIFTVLLDDDLVLGFGLLVVAELHSEAVGT